MYYDLNIAWPVSIPQAGSSNNNAASKKKQQKGKQAVNSNNDARDAAPKVGIDLLSAEERADVEKSVKMAIKLGYSTIAFNVTLPLNSYDPNTIANYVPCHSQLPAFPDLDTRTANTSNGAKTVLQLSRLTVVLDEKSVNGGGKGNGSCFTSTNANAIAGYNLIAVQPLDAASFQHTCLNLSNAGPTGVDIITIDLASSPRVPFQLKRSLVLKAIAEGTMFEVVYAPAMRLSTASSSLPKEARRNIIAGARELIRITNGKGIILSSEVRNAIEMRGPLDLCNFGTILGFKPDQAKDSVSGNARLAVIRGHAARQTYRGVIANPKVVEVKAVIPTQPVASSSKTKATAKAVLPPSLPEKPVATQAPAEEDTTVGSKRKRGAEQEASQRKKK
ncbi:PHP domain-like protein [Cystobasidium minutum MCA 4210]|uniref:PHP domain-like protein n=1 Tax=Cystobasidium minutum MCA 4210 TaxID=1397322 RepID=UPI0034CEB080|eukprot:jgi/Rhomi1/161952/estExt_Genewise1Plus.C_5_t10440